MSIGDKLLQLRKENHMSQEELAEKINVSRQTISKWETNQTTPDFDKIVPLCDLFGISTDELLRGEKIINNNNNNEVFEINDSILKRKTALVVSISVFLYFLSIIWIIFSSEIGFKEWLSVCGFLVLCGIATVSLVYHFMSMPKIKKEEKIITEKDKRIKSILNIISIIVLIIYLLISFITMAWHITWIIWIVYALIEEIVKLIFKLGDDFDE